MTSTEKKIYEAAVKAAMKKHTDKMLKHERKTKIKQLNSIKI